MGKIWQHSASKLELWSDSRQAIHRFGYDHNTDISLQEVTHALQSSRGRNVQSSDV
jgi:hypothetical protein